jgi:2-C-methyl-D-erythritol 2,4-cyclodiphosphate synthase
VTLRIGNGFDVHAFVAQRKLVLGGVTVPRPRARRPLGRGRASAICDAILGALAQGDLGVHFPDDPRWKGADNTRCCGVV